MPALLLPLLIVPLMFGVGVWVVWRFVLTRPAQPLALPPPRSPPRLREEEPPAPQEPLLRYPSRLEALEDQLVEAHRLTQQQLQHLSVRAAELSAKGGRDEIAARYTADGAALDRRAASLRRVMGVVWRTRAVLRLRVELALAAQHPPDLSHLPDPADVPAARLGEAAAAAARASAELRRFVGGLDAAAAGLEGVVPSPPPSAEVDKAQRDTVQAELKEARATLALLRERMDRLADTLDYLGDRLRTRQLVADAPLQLDLEPQAGQLLEEVAQALAALEALSEAGERHHHPGEPLPGAEPDPVEQLALCAQAEADASLEIERLLKQLAP